MTPLSSVTRFGNVPSSGYWELTENGKRTVNTNACDFGRALLLTSISDTGVDQKGTVGVDFDDELKVIYRVHQLVRPGAGFVGGGGVDSSSQRTFGEVGNDLVCSRSDLWLLGDVDSVVFHLTLMVGPLGNDFVAFFQRYDIPDLAYEISRFSCLSRYN